MKMRKNSIKKSLKTWMDESLGWYGEVEHMTWKAGEVMLEGMRERGRPLRRMLYLHENDVYSVCLLGQLRCWDNCSLQLLVLGGSGEIIDLCDVICLHHKLHPFISSEAWQAHSTTYSDLCIKSQTLIMMALIHSDKPNNSAITPPLPDISWRHQPVMITSFESTNVCDII